MPTPVKPCDGHFSEELQAVLTRNRNREQWGVYPCELCGALVGAAQVHGKWVPEQHWPSVKRRQPAAGPEPRVATGFRSDFPQDSNSAEYPL
jgi:hypothetical protein